MNKVGIILGTRPEAIKLFPVYKALKEKNLHVELVSTGQHKEMLEALFDFFSVRADVELNVMQKGQTLAQLSSKVMLATEKYLLESKPDLVVVQGDTTTCFVASLAAFYLKIPVVHVEAGLRTYNKYSPFPEEINRKMVGCIADIHFAPTTKAVATLAQESINHNVFQVGNTVVDALLWAKEIVESKVENYFKKFEFLHEDDKVVLITSHRRENFGGGLSNICDAILELAAQYPSFQFVYPVHLNPSVKKVVEERLSGRANIHLIAPLDYDMMVFLMSKSYMILTDSGGIQEEAPTFGVPLLVLRENTERPEGVDEGCAVLVGANKEKIVSTFRRVVNEQVYNSMAKAKSPYGDGSSAQRIAEHISQYLKK